MWAPGTGVEVAVAVAVLVAVAVAVLVAVAVAVLVALAVSLGVAAVVAVAVAVLVALAVSLGVAAVVAVAAAVLVADGLAVAAGVDATRQSGAPPPPLAVPLAPPSMGKKRQWDPFAGAAGIGRAVTPTRSSPTSDAMGRSVRV
jgi:hypothetical protein